MALKLKTNNTNAASKYTTNGSFPLLEWDALKREGGHKNSHWEIKAK